jgi:FtsH-binding integral membrane protein
MPATFASSSAALPPNPQTIADRKLRVGSGYVMLILALALFALCLWFGIAEMIGHAPGQFPFFSLSLGLVGIIISLALLPGLVILQPNESLVCLFLGSYVGTERRPGFWWSTHST